MNVRQNYVLQPGAPAIVETGGAGRNRYEGNWADGDGPDPWRIGSPTSAVEDQTPPVDAYPGLTPGGDGSEGRGNRTVRVEFDKPYADPPKVAFGRCGGGIRNVAYATDENGDFVAATVTVAEGDGAAVDLFVESA
ncbi:hypothetical protein [Halorussus sp. MSC15.2]|uniref:hypothetical protein n=1 Tax=Halorussus sp. MSC15.2 TaxID=2283638 RepID=UPI0013D6FEF3|nr:hypothetical protein [Halorussus sp. MSC15.2]NEU56041.1 hypothetical protein [Halorussus sp. MSC15.2]